MKKRLAWMLPPLEGGGHVGCLNCGGRGHTLRMGALIAVGFGDAHVSRDGVVVYQEVGAKKLKTLAGFERRAAKEPRRHDWRAVLHGPLHGETYQRQGPREWVLVERNQGFA